MSKPEATKLQFRLKQNNFSITTFGFEQYAKVYVDDYASIVELVGLQIVNYNQTNSLEISAASNQPVMIVNHILDMFEIDGMVRLLKISGGDNKVHIYIVTPELKRRLNEIKK